LPLRSTRGFRPRRAGLWTPALVWRRRTAPVKLPIRLCLRNRRTNVSEGRPGGRPSPPNLPPGPGGGDGGEGIGVSVSSRFRIGALLPSVPALRRRPRGKGPRSSRSLPPRTPSPPRRAGAPPGGEEAREGDAVGSMLRRMSGTSFQGVVFHRRGPRGEARTPPPGRGALPPMLRRARRSAKSN